MATEPANPYAASEALASEDAQASRRRPGRLAALVLAILAYPLTGAGFYMLGRRRRLVAWIATGLFAWMLMIVAVRLPQPKLCVIALAAMMLAVLTSFIATAFTRPEAPPKRRAFLIAALLIVAGRGGSFVVKHRLAEAFKMPSGSMVPTLLVGDHMMVKKGRSGIERGDVIVFEFPQDRSTDYVKRVVALGGDRVEVTRGIVSINGIALAHADLEEDCPELEEPGWCKLVRETNTGRSYTIMLMPGRPAVDLPPVTVPAGEVYVLGDNRDNSSDSRRWGGVPVDAIKGKTTLIYMSSDPKTGVRWSRFGRGVD